LHAEEDQVRDTDDLERDEGGLRLSEQSREADARSERPDRKT
jgi:hypothetical protein